MKLTENTKILLVEDNLVNQRVAALIMKRLNLKCEIASDGEKAFEMYKESLYDLIFMDIEMPVMNGLESSKLIREFEKSVGFENRTSIIALTASEPADLGGKYLEAGMDGFIEKPLRADLLADFLENFCRDTETRREMV
jgi:FOG: CheY-like receiver